MNREEVEVVPGVLGPMEFATMPMSDPGTGHQVTAVIRFDSELRRYTCDELTITRDGPRLMGPERQVPITTETMRGLKAGEMFEWFLGWQLENADEGKGLRELPNPGSVEPWGRTMPEGLASEGPTDRVLKWVAHFYRYSVALGDQPTGAIQERMGVSRATAGRWVSAARERGYLGAALPGKAGERVS